MLSDEAWHGSINGGQRTRRRPLQQQDGITSQYHKQPTHSGGLPRRSRTEPPIKINDGGVCQRKTPKRGWDRLNPGKQQLSHKAPCPPNLAEVLLSPPPCLTHNSPKTRHHHTALQLTSLTAPWLPGTRKKTRASCSSRSSSTRAQETGYVLSHLLLFPQCCDAPAAIIVPSCQRVLCTTTTISCLHLHVILIASSTRLRNGVREGAAPCVATKVIQRDQRRALPLARVNVDAPSHTTCNRYYECIC